VNTSSRQKSQKNRKSTACLEDEEDPKTRKTSGVGSTLHGTRSSPSPEIFLVFKSSSSSKQVFDGLFFYLVSAAAVVPRRAD
jgi:hypothetical protein